MLHFIKSLNPFTGSRGSRAEMERQWKDLPAHVQEGIKKGELRFADTVIYSIKPLEKTIRMFEEKDDREVGFRNISKGRLSRNQCLLLSGMRLMVVISETTNKEDVLASTLAPMESSGGALNSGEFSLTVNQHVVIPETPNLVFRTECDAVLNAPTSYYKLASPYLIKDEEAINLTVQFDTLKGLYPGFKHNILAALYGTITTP
jgi:hypothetical protein